MRASTARPALIRASAAGTVAGLVGTVAMSLLMLPAQWLGLLGTQPPRRVSDRALKVLGVERKASEPERRLGTVVAHLAIGAAAGGILGLGRHLTAHRGPGPIVGAAYGSGLWALNYVALAPALDLFPPPHRDRPGRPPVMLAANALFGAVTATLVDRLLHGAPAPRRGGILGG